MNDTGSSLASTEAHTLTYPDAPTNVVATAVSTTQINLTWTAPSGTIIGYVILRGTTPGGENGPVIGGRLQQGTTAYSDDTCNAGTTYYYVVLAVNGSNNSVYSNEATALTYPAAPTGLTATDDATHPSTQIDLELDRPERQRNSYRLQHLPQHDQ